MTYHRQEREDIKRMLAEAKSDHEANTPGDSVNYKFLVVGQGKKGSAEESDQSEKDVESSGLSTTRVNRCKDFKTVKIPLNVANVSLKCLYMNA